MGQLIKIFNSFDKGVTITLKIDSTTHPKDLNWIGINKPDAWLKVLSVKTGLGAIFGNKDININISVVKDDGNKLSFKTKGVGYLYVQDLPNVRRSIPISELERKTEEYFKKKGLQAKVPGSLQNFDVIYEYWNAQDLKRFVELTDDEREILEKYSPFIYCGYAYSTKLFNDFNDQLGLRSNYKILTGGFQIASNNMPQGEIYQIPLQRYIGRQNQIHFVIHFDNYSPDLGRKGYNKELVDFCKTITEKISIKYLNKFKPYLRPATGAMSDIIRSKRIDDWKIEMTNYEEKHPLVLVSDKFFLPTKKISITSNPTREQDVIALFNQLVAGGVIRGIKIMSTNERFTYDGLYRIVIEQPTLNHIYDSKSNPLGIFFNRFDR